MKWYDRANALNVAELGGFHMREPEQSCLRGRIPGILGPGKDLHLSSYLIAAVYKVTVTKPCSAYVSESGMNTLCNTPLHDLRACVTQSG